MRILVLGLLLPALLLGVASAVLASGSASQTVRFAVTAVNEIAVSGDPGPLTIVMAAAGSDPAPVSDSSTTYSVTTTGVNKKITGRLDRAMPTGTTLRITLAAPAGATSRGAVALNRDDENLVTGITKKAAGAKTITYSLDTTAEAGTISESSRVVTLTITDGA